MYYFCQNEMHYDGEKVLVFTESCNTETAELKLNAFLQGKMLFLSKLDALFIKKYFCHTANV